MIILAYSIILSLNGGAIIDKANEAVKAMNLDQVQNIANIAWAKTYLDGKKTNSEFEQAVIGAMERNKVDNSKYYIEVTVQGVAIFEICEENILNKLNGQDIEFSADERSFTYKYNFLENKQIESIMVSSREDLKLGELSAKNNWNLSCNIPEMAEIIFDEKENTLSIKIIGVLTGAFSENILFKFKFTDKSVATDWVRYSLIYNAPV